MEVIRQSQVYKKVIKAMYKWPKPEERAGEPVELPEPVQPKQPGDCIEGEAPCIIRNGDLSLTPNALTRNP